MLEEVVTREQLLALVSGEADVWASDQQIKTNISLLVPDMDSFQGLWFIPSK